MTKKDEAKKDDNLSNIVNDNMHKSRTIMIVGEINLDMAQPICAKLLAMAFENDEPITVIINSNGGHVEAGDMIHDMIKFVKPRVRIVATGYAASAGALIFIAAEKADRYSLPNTRFLLHQPAGGIGGTASDIKIQRDEIVKMRTRLNQLFVVATGQNIKQIEKDTDRDFWLTNEEAKEYGLVSEIITSMSDIK
ncbi:MAG: ATP-dependent Clp protease proteolytic subunit [OCS116 cluster bacterium]|uniref:ATP-dependent Clp protease proteolytic subunit n=1 Tax=OCS116 cluster bacterium TaxID=2030921 RepID=A0A2A4Z6I0_9PROT|nr:ATP-dependent Clp protease proteolytic subunit [OCS116 cluster bacterium]